MKINDRRSYLDAGAPPLPPGTVLDQFGKPVASINTFYEGGDRWRNGDRSMIFHHDGAQDTDKLLDVSTWADMMTAARFLFANEPMVRGALLEQACLSFPLTPQYRGKDKKWGDRVGEPWLNQWKANKTVRGPAFTNDICARLRLIARKLDGDCPWVLTHDKDDEFPRIQYLRAHRIGDPRTGTSIDGFLKDGPLAGHRVCNGVAVNDQGKPIAYHVLGDTPDGDKWIPAGSMFMTYNPDAFDECRGKSELLASVTSYADVKRLRAYEMRAQQLYASVAFMEDTESGSATDSAQNALTRADNDTDTQGSAAGLVRRTYEQGMHLYFKAMSGAGLKAFRGDRPSRDSQTWEDKMVGAAIFGSGWDPNFALQLKQPGGALARIMVEKIRRTIELNQQLEACAQRIEDSYALASAIALDVIEPPSDGDVMSWEYQGPPRLTADSGNEFKAKLQAYREGTISLQKLISEEGGNWENHRGQKRIEAANLAEGARLLHQEYPEMSFVEWMNFLEQRNINPSGDSEEKEEGKPAKPADPGD